jgi:non-ribosomal peptide synthetase-like protein
MVMARFCARLRKTPDLPTVSMKDVYARPTITSLAAPFGPAPAPVGDDSVATALAAVFAEVTGVATASVDGNFFDDLGADSMVMARFCARLRKRDDLPTVSIKDVYAHPTAASLAAAFAPAAAPVQQALRPVEPVEPPMITTSLARAASAVRGVRHRQVKSSRPRYLLCGALQFLSFVVYSSLTALATFRGFAWISTGGDLREIYLRAVLFGAGMFLALSTLPILAKWVLIGRWKPQQIRVWSMAYLRFWIVRTLVQRSPLAAFVGSPLYAFYLRALGAKVGRGVAIFSKNVPVCTDLLTVGDGTLIRKDAFFTGYRVHDGLLQTASITLGRNVFVGEKTVLDIGTSLGDGAQLGHTSSLYAGQSVPAGERWHGSPAQPTDADYRAVWQGTCSTLRRTVFTVVQLLNLLVLFGPLMVVAVTVLLTRVPLLAALLDPSAPAFTSWMFYREALIASAVLFFGFTLLGLVVTLTLPRLLNLTLSPGKVYRLYGYHYWAHRLITRLTNRKFFTELFGDSSYIVGYLRAVGYKLTPVVQTGSNFGMAVQHDNPYLSAVGTGTVVADGLSLINADYSSTSFRVSRVSIGRNNFLGNNIAYPAQGRTGDNCLLATKVMVPIDGRVRENVGLLGSPSFEIPRSVERDNSLDVAGPDDLRRRLRGKNRHNAVSMVVRLAVRWAHFFGIVVFASGVENLSDTLGVAALAPFSVVSVLYTVGYFVLVERAVDSLQILRPNGCSIYDRAFWRHERAWKVPSETYFKLFDGTPFKTVLWRLLGVRIGRRVFDDGCFLTERTFVTIGDGCTLNVGTVIQCHSQEDGAFKSDCTALGAGVTLGVAAFVHYGVTVGDGAVLAADSFLMKGEEVPANALWGGNPAKKMREHSADLRTRRISRHDGAVLVGSA